MALLRTEPRDSLGTRICVGCGYRGRELQGDPGDTRYECPVCGEDLYARPPMSYREMEGFTACDADGAPASRRAEASASKASDRSLRRLLVAESAIALVVLVAAAVVMAV